AVTVGGQAATGTINDPAAPTVTSVSNASATEGSDLVHTVTLSGATLNPTTYAFTLADGTATAGSDYTASPTISDGVTLAAGVLTVPAGVSSFTITYPTLADALADGGETTAVTVGGQAATGTINDPAAPTVTSVSNASATEGSDLVHTVTLSGATLNPTTNAFTLADGTATAGSDYTASPTFSDGVTLAAGVLTVPAGVSSFTITYPTIADALADGGETTAVTVGGQGATGTINDPAAPTVASVSNASATEGSDLVHTVTLSGATLNPTTYAFTLADGTATAGSDYTASPVFSDGVTLAAGVLTVPAGVSSFTITYPTLADALADGGETTAVTVGGQAATGTINDPAAPTVASVGDAPAATGTSLVTTVTLAGAAVPPA